MAKARIGHFVEAQVLQELGVDYIDESEVLSPADYVNHIDKWSFTVPFVCGATNLGEALRRINEGAAMIRSKGEAGTGDVSEATKHIRKISSEINVLRSMTKDELYVAAKELQAPYELVAEIAETGKLPVVLFVAGGVATPADAAMMMQLGADGVFVGSGIFKSGNPAAARRGHRQGDHVLRRRQGDRRRVARSRRGDGRHQRLRPRRAAPPRRARLVTTLGVHGVGVLALQGDVREHARVLTDLGADVDARCAAPTELAAVDGLVHPRRRVERHRQARRARSACASRSATRSPRACRSTARARDSSCSPTASPTASRASRPSAGWTSPCGATPSAARSTRSRSTSTSPALGEPPVHAVFIRAPLVEEAGDGVETLATLDDGRVVAVRQGIAPRHLVPPGGDGRAPLPRAVPRHGARAGPLTAARATRRGRF